MEIAILGLGCFWGPEIKFSKLDGVIKTEVGYCGGDSSETNYKEVCTGKTNHAEVVKLDFDPKAPRPNYERLPQPEIDRRVLNCINLRYKADKPILQREWVELCKEQYGDKSVPQYINYWTKAKEEWEEGWRGELENLLEPAIETLREGLSSDNHYFRSKTIDQIWKMSGNDIQKHHVLTQQIQVGFTPTEED